MASFSFQSSKNLTAGEGGIITTNDDALAAACRSIHNCGRVDGGDLVRASRDLGQLSPGRIPGRGAQRQLDRLDGSDGHARCQRRAISRRASAGAARASFRSARPAACTRHAYHLFMLRLDPAVFGAPRDAVLPALEAEGIPCSAGYGYSLPAQPLFRNKAFGPYLAARPRSARLHARRRCPNSDLDLPSRASGSNTHLLLGTRDDMDDIAAAFEKVHQHRDAARGADDRASWRPRSGGSIATAIWRRFAPGWSRSCR